MAYVSVPKDLTQVKNNVLFGMTKRQIVCSGAAFLMGLSLFFLLLGSIPTNAAALVMTFAMLLDLLFELYEKHRKPLDVEIEQIIRNRLNKAGDALPSCLSSHRVTEQSFLIQYECIFVQGVERDVAGNLCVLGNHLLVLSRDSR